MPLFRSTGRRNASMTCERVAQQIERAARAMGFDAYIDFSRISASAYVYINASEPTAGFGEDGLDSIKIRVSDHTDRQVDADFRVWCDERAARETGQGSWFEAIEWLAAQTGAAVPATAKAARTRHNNKMAQAAAIEARHAEQAAEWQRRREDNERRIREWNPERWAEIAGLMGKSGRRKRNQYRRQAREALGISNKY